MNRLLRMLFKLFRNEEGNVSLMVAGGMVTFLLIAALVSDVGLLFVRQQKLQNALDAGVLAGIQRILSGEEAAEEQARSYVQLNGAVVSTAEANAEEKTLRVTGEEVVSLAFARIMGMNESTVTAAAGAKAGTMVGMKGLVPIAVPDQSFSYGSLYELNEGAGDGYSGNYGYLDFNGGGANAVAENIKYGYEGHFNVGDKVPTKTGINHGKVETAIDYRINSDGEDTKCQSYRTADRNCDRIVFLPVIDSLDVDGTKPVTIVGFAAFYLEDTDRGKGGHMIIEGRFLRMIAPGEMGTGTNYGVYAVKLTE